MYPVLQYPRIKYRLLPVRLQTVTFWQTMSYSTPYILMITSAPITRVWASVMPPSRSTMFRLISSQCYLNFCQSLPPIYSANWLHPSVVNCQSKKSEVPSSTCCCTCCYIEMEFMGEGGSTSVVKRWSWKAESSSSTLHHTSRGIENEFMSKCCSDLSSVRTRWQDIIQPGREDSQYLWQSEWDYKMGMIECIIGCTIRWYEMLQDVMQTEIYLLWVLPNIYSPLHSPSPLPLHLCMLPSPSPFLSSLYIRTPAVASVCQAQW